MSTAASTAGNGYAVGVEVDGVRYPSARQADAAIGLPVNTTRHRAHSKLYPTYRWLGATPGPRPVRRPKDCTLAKPLIEPERWSFNGDLTHRAFVMDPNVEPSKLVRRIGWLNCMRCSRPHFSEDVLRIRLCCACGGLGGTPAGADPDFDA